MEREELLHHLNDLKGGVLRSITFFLILFAISYLLSSGIIAILIKPISSKINQSMIGTGLADGFLLHMNIAFSSAIFITIPYIFYEIYRFCVLGMKQEEKIAMKILMFVCVFLFIFGALIAYRFIIPSALDFFISFFGQNIRLQPKILDYIDLILSIMIAFGAAFEAPILIFLLHVFNIIKAESFKKYRKHMIIGVFIISAILTPPDIASQIVLASIILILIEFAFLFCKIFDKLKTKSA